MLSEEQRSDLFSKVFCFSPLRRKLALEESRLESKVIQVCPGEHSAGEHYKYIRLRYLTCKSCRNAKSPAKKHSY